ncbi:hypothetical protein ACO2Q8_09135 [Larkinella sp. VNQ87]|uniref:hypothetical protein n=1 Tax=Larkinella sp. VNQ87 TaxID=3400921 RepID=UPI003BFBFC1F
MEDNDKVEPDYLKGFNEGYTMAQYQPELAEKLAHIETDFIRAVAFRDGYQQYHKEKTRERLPSWLKEDRFSKDTPSPDKDKTRDIEPEKD